MRRSLVAISAFLVILLAAGGVAGAAPRSAPASGTKAYCATFVDLLEHLAGSESAARTPANHRRVVALMRTAPKGAARAADQLGRTLLVLIDDGPKHVRAADKKKAANAGATLVAWGGRHCPAVRRQVAAARARAGDRRAQSNLRNGLTNAKGMYTDTDSYTSVTPTLLAEAEPSLHWVSGPTAPTDPKSVSVHVVDAAHIVMAAGTGTTCFYIRDDATGAGTEFAAAPGAACDASTPPAVFTIRWK